MLLGFLWDLPLLMRFELSLFILWFQASQKGSDDGSGTIQESTYRITKKVEDLQFWDQRIQSFCRGLDVYFVALVDNNSLAIESQGM